MKPRNSGFTLVELAAVILLIGLASTLVITNLDNLVPKYRVRASARLVANLMVQARQMARTSGFDVYLEYDADKAMIRIIKPVDNKETGKVELQTVYENVLNDGVDIKSVIAPASGERTKGTSTIVFRPYGISGTHGVNLKGEDYTMSVKINGLTGFVEFFEYEVTPEMFNVKTED